MCDLLPDTRQSSIICPSENISPKEKLSQCSNENENDKDNAPEVLEKPDACSSVSREILQKLAYGTLSLYLDDTKKISSSLNELTRNQNIVIETLEQENSKLSDALKMYNLDEMKRAMRLQQQKQKEALQKELQRDRELERDKQLAPKIATKSANE
ncbi:biogenesis of lysosome-related organelles complex 1 subunit 6-like isoform X2 [Stegodyphus dumicola]|uniref:biogenesis of lysosome-related organelles complex 1 subunit 6-like isoform X2 n=1 Tax=Stegodyphus dumicola TaxID=202533 RepID=UPI0015B3088F|nr:biogenesis of lysosome-related organelles complex 1 subunit 6-like isoform X2 [Stegodyphus dumicola]